MTTIHGYSPSGNCHKLRLLLEQLGRPYRWIETDSSRGETRTPQYLALNPNGKVPMLVREDGGVLVESNAILYYLAEGSAFLSDDPWMRAQALSWMFFEQYSHEPFIAVGRFICGWTPLDSPRRVELPWLRERGHQALAVMERHLAAHEWFSGPRYGVADIALYAYTGVAEDGGFDLAPYPALRAWLGRVRATPGFLPMPPPAPENAALIAASR
ncbi:glutathione S-transferase family protein [Luteimonas composti]|uniref:Glutathione S-transferase family protein n=1 Tax=Luteimonas composti TaxID=398257 RepID=A0ABT6MLT0_9GAMM|nr:glutathione S-transferase family protein [Luteimonas composti]MDH7451586.1 glutathione S-transferase family protein [Luteimonas composti]